MDYFRGFLCTSRRQRSLPAKYDVDARLGGGRRFVPATVLSRRKSRYRRIETTLLPLALKLHSQRLLRKEQNIRQKEEEVKRTTKIPFLSSHSRPYLHSTIPHSISIHIRFINSFYFILLAYLMLPYPQLNGNTQQKTTL